MSRKPGRAVHAKMRLKQKASNYIWPTTVPLGASAAVNDHLHQKRMLANSKFLGNVMITVFNVPPTNKITIFQALLAKLKTRKGGLGKNEHPAGLTTRKGSSGKNGALKRIYFPGGSKTRKGDPGKNGMQKMNDES
ncbi:hypothetical protein MTR_3g050903 [Medicago truncatula]|uniref:Uncharacterized protein n=1 Tax=Medicago truncatula TaxID=3880 RepID=A0A072UVG2_MEDTR|nr:hypothetical protein MTR_3g050903 [Medicago truncatula]